MSTDNKTGMNQIGLSEKQNFRKEKKKHRSPEEKKERRLKLVYIMFSFLFACLLWGMVMQKVNPKIHHVYSGIKVEIINQEALADRSLAVVDTGHQFVSVKIIGKRSAIMDLNASEILATADVSKLKKGENYARVQVSTPNDVDCDSVNPSQIKVKVEPILSEERPVEVTFTGYGSDSGELVAIGQEIDSVQVTGTKSAISKVEKVMAVVDSDQVSDLRTDYRAGLMAVDKKGAQVSGVRTDRKFIMVQTQMYVKKEVPLTTSVKGEPAEGYKLLGITAPEKIHILLPSEENADVESVTADPVDITDLKKSRTVDLVLDMPENTRLARGEKKPKAQIDIGEMTSRAFKFNTDEIEIMNLPEGTTVEFPSDSIDLHLIGVVTELSKVKRSDISVSVDATEADPSMTTLPLSVTVGRDEAVQERIEAEEKEMQVVIS